MRKSLRSVALTAAAVLALPAAASAATNASIQPGFTPNRLGAPTNIIMTVSSTNAQAGLAPAPSQKAVIHLPAGIAVSTTGFPTCSKATLQSKGPSGCPKGSQVGSGSAVIQAQLGAQPISENATVTVFVGPKQGSAPVLELYTNGQTPISTQIVLEGVLGHDNAPYGAQLVVPIPPIPTVPGGPQAAIQTFSVKVGGSYGKKAKKGKKGKKAKSSAKKNKKSRKKNKNLVYLVTAPKQCPAGGFQWGADITYTDGTSSVTAKTPCP